MLDRSSNRHTVSRLSTVASENRTSPPRRLPSDLQGLAGTLANRLIVLPVAVGLFSSTAAAADEYQFGAARVTFDGVSVTFHNDLTSAADFPREFSFDLTEGITVEVIILHGAGNTPDSMVVIPPAGYAAYPDMVTVEEHDSGVIIVTGGLS